MNSADLYKLQKDAFDHLLHGRARLALPIAEKLVNEQPNNAESNVCYAWSLLENGNPLIAMEYLNKSKEMAGNTIIAQTYRAYLHLRLSSFEGAVYDFNMTQDVQKDMLAWSYYNKSKALGAMGSIKKAAGSYELAIMMDRGAHKEWESTRKYFDRAEKLIAKKENFDESDIAKYQDYVQAAIEAKEYWFALLISKKVLESGKSLENEQTWEIFLLESMFRLNQLTPVLQKLPELKEKYPNNEKLSSIENALNTYEKKSVEFKSSSPTSGSSNDKYSVKYSENNLMDIFSIRLFDGKAGDDKKEFFNEFNISSIQKIGVEVIFNNPFFNKEAKKHQVFIAWYLNEEIIHQGNVEVEVPSDWDAMMFRQYCDASSSPFWGEGEGRVEIFLERKNIATKNFLVSEKSVIDNSEPGKEKPSEDKAKSDEINFEEVLSELDSNIGLNSIKKSVRELIDYIEFMKERKQIGLKAQDKIAINAIFLGNPGTGKTTIARLMGRIFKGMGLLKEGKVIEVDRAELVGQYIGETAQKTEKIIESAMGNVLFIDEAYTLVKQGGSGQDFGQEAIDVLLKRMEDKKGDFFVIAAGYPNEMQSFLEANPGMKSRMTHTFNFEDYTPEEMMAIFRKMMIAEEYKITPGAEETLVKEFTKLYRNRDQNFGNARTVRKFFEDAKMALSKRYLQTPKHERTRDKMVTITLDDIQSIISPVDESKKVDIPIDEEKLNSALKKLESLTGLTSVQNDVREMVKLAKYYRNLGEDIRSKFTSHILFLGNPGTGKTTVARIIGDIFSGLGVLPRGHLIETDRKGLVASYVGQTADKTNLIIDKSMGGTLFIDEAYTLVKKGDSGSDFGTEAIDALLKRMEDDRGKFITIAAGYTNEMKEFLESNPGMKSRFTKTFHFEDYTPDELLEIAERIATSQKKTIYNDAKIALQKHFNEIYRNRDKNFGNARIVRNIMDGAEKRMLSRLTEIPHTELTNEQKTTYRIEDFSDILPQKAETVKKVFKGDEQKLQKHLASLESLTGLTSVKESVTKLVSGLKIAKIRRERGMQVMEKPLHSVFTGNPGTGKTTVARIMSDIFRELGIIEKGHLVEVDRAQLVAGYQGQTAIKTDAVIKQALGGTLFIDEAYTLSRGGNDFGQEAIETLLKRMEDYRGQFICIVAGYTNEMKTFMETNPGLTSRFTNTFEFEDYTPGQLMKICEIMAKSSGYKISPNANVRLLTLFDTLYQKRDKNFGNARTARNILFDVISLQEERLAAMIEHNDDDLATIEEEDVSKLNIV